MSALRILTLSATSMLAVAFTRGEAWAIGVPDSGTCNTSTDCFKITNSSGVAIKATSGSSAALYATSTSNLGLFASSAGSSAGVYGISTSGTGILGFAGSSSSPGSSGVAGQALSQGANGVTGINNVGGATGFGVKGAINSGGSGSAVYGDAGGSFTAWAGNFNGDVTGRDFFGNSFTPSSDARLKKDIENAPYGLAEVMKLRPVTYKWKASDADPGTQVGLVAQEVQGVVPELVRARGAAGTLSLNYNGLVPVVVKAVQEQQKMILAQQKVMADQAARIEALERALKPSTISSNAKGGLGALAAMGLVPIGMFVARRRRKTRSPE